MALTRDFKQTVQARVKRDSAFRKALLREAIKSFSPATSKPARSYSGISSTPRWVSPNSDGRCTVRPRA